MPLPLPARSSPVPARARPAAEAPGILAVVLDRDDVQLTLPAAIAVAREEDRRLCVAVIRPVPLRAANPAVTALLAEETDRQLTDILALVLARTTEVDQDPVISVHLLAGLRGRRRRQVLERAVERLAQHYDARPLGTWAA